MHSASRASLPPAALPAIDAVMSASRANFRSSVRFVADESVRALSATLLLLGLIGDRRVR